MKAYTVIIVLFFLVLSHTSKAQVDEIGLYYDRSGFIQEINAEQKYLVVNFPSLEEIIEERVLLIDPKTKTPASGLNDLSKLRLGMEVQIVGDMFPKQGISVAKSVMIKPVNKKINIDKGRLDDITPEYAVVDGHKIRLKSGEKIAGEKKSLYRNKTFNSFNELKLGDFVDVKGIWDEKGFVLADEVVTFPDLETDTDMAMRGVGEKSLHNLFADDWLDPAKRTKLLGKLYDGAPIVNSNVLQSYIQTLGMKLVPDHLRSKFKFMFMVVGDPEWNAYAQPDGLVVIKTGLLETMENEAQLLAVLGHEITHTIYEHSANKATNRKELKQEGKSNQAVADVGTTLAKNMIDWAKLPPISYSIVSKYKLKQNIDSLSKALGSLQKAKQGYNESMYAIGTEAQSDRVGLYWMARAGYDPREAMKVWREQYNSDYHFEAKATSKGLVEAGSYSKEFDRYHRPPTLSDIGVYFFKNTLKNRAKTLNNQAYDKKGRLNTHPDDLKRFAALNKHLYLFFPTLNESTKLGRNELLKALDDANAEMEKAARLLEEKNAREYAKRVALDKAYEKAKARIKLQLTGHETILLNYKDYKVTKCLTLKELVGKAKCNVPALESHLTELYNKYSTETNQFVNEFKAGTIPPHQKNAEFAVNYSIARAYNEFMVDIAARYIVCDTESLNSVRATIERDEIKQFITPSTEAMTDVLRYLNSLEKKEKKE